jgi:orotidine-5'-phosphate decarboxylase
MSAFMDSLNASWDRSNSLVCVGLDPEIERLPRDIAMQPSPIFQFNKAIIDATADLVCAYKPQFAHYAAYEAEDQLERTIEYIHRSYPGIPVILDSKRGDVGNTALRYAIEAFERYGADAVTVNPYLGGDSLEPFLQYEDKGVIILCRTSNPGGRDLQDLDVGGRKLYQVVADMAARRWNSRGNCSLVVGATQPRELAEVREIVGKMPFLVPGVGAQGGDVAAAVTNGQTADGTGLIISSSRAILYAGSDDTFSTAARAATEALRDQINASRSRANTACVPSERCRARRRRLPMQSRRYRGCAHCCPGCPGRFGQRGDSAQRLRCRAGLPGSTESSFGRITKHPARSVRGSDDPRQVRRSGPWCRNRLDHEPGRQNLHLPPATPGTLVKWRSGRRRRLRRSTAPTRGSGYRLGVRAGHRCHRECG